VCTSAQCLPSTPRALCLAIHAVSPSAGFPSRHMREGLRVQLLRLGGLLRPVRVGEGLHQCALGDGARAGRPPATTARLRNRSGRAANGPPQPGTAYPAGAGCLSCKEVQRPEQALLCTVCTHAQIRTRTHMYCLISTVHTYAHTYSQQNINCIRIDSKAAKHSEIAHSTRIP